MNKSSQKIFVLAFVIIAELGAAVNVRYHPQSLIEEVALSPEANEPVQSSSKDDDPMTPAQSTHASQLDKKGRFNLRGPKKSKAEEDKARFERMASFLEHAAEEAKKREQGQIGVMVDDFGTTTTTMAPFPHLDQVLQGDTGERYLETGSAARLTQPLSEVEQSMLEMHNRRLDEATEEESEKPRDVHIEGIVEEGKAVDPFSEQPAEQPAAQTSGTKKVHPPGRHPRLRGGPTRPERKPRLRGLAAK